MTFFKDNEKSIQKISTASISVKRSFVLPDFDEEFPLYILQLRNDELLILFGQWLYDPHVLLASEKLFEQWECESFFADFLLKYDAETGKVLELRVESEKFISAKQLSEPLQFTHLRECEFIKGTGGDLVRNLQDASLVKVNSRKNRGVL